MEGFIDGVELLGKRGEKVFDGVDMGVLVVGKIVEVVGEVVEMVGEVVEIGEEGEGMRV